jgi:large subunit ribosomal protein L1
MKKNFKRLDNLRKLISEIPKQNLDQAIDLLKKTGTAKFIESVEAHVNLNIDPKYANQQLRASISLPNGTGKTLRIAAFTEPDYVEEVLKLGATIAGSDDLLEEISAGNLNFDLLITTPQLMPKLTKVGRILGPKGLMPSPKSGTVTQNLGQTIKEFQKGKVEYREDKTGIVHLSFGKANFSELELKENLTAVYSSIEKNKPTGVKGRYFKSFSICTTMGPGIEIDLNSFKKI